MNNMQFDEATQTYRGTVEPYRVSEDGISHMGFTKPLQVAPEWMGQSYLDVFASYWQDQWQSEGGGEAFSVKPWAYMQQHQGQALLAQATDDALQQLIQAMAGFAPMDAGQVQESVAGLFAAMQMLGVDS